MNLPDRDTNTNPLLAYEGWLAKQLFGKTSGKKNPADLWVTTCLLTLLQPSDVMKIAKDAPAKAKDDAKGDKDEWNVRANDRETLKKTMTKSIAAINAAIDAKKKEAERTGKKVDDIGERIDFDAVKKEWDEGKFGPKSREALKRVTEFLEVGTLKHLQLLDRHGLGIPTGCPIEVPFDKSGRHIGDELFRAKLAKNEIKFTIFGKELEDGKMPSTDEIVRLAKAESFIVESQGVLKSALIRTQAGKLLLEIKSFEDPKDPSTKLTGWYPKQELINRDPNETPEQRRKNDLELEKWIAATTLALEPAQRAKSYAQTIGFLHYISGRRTESDFERFVNGLPTFQRMIAWGKGVEEKDRVFPNDAIQPENFPGKIEIDPKTGLVISARPFMPPSPERTREFHEAMWKVNKWLDKNGPDIDQIQRELALLVAGGAVYPEGHPKAGQPIISTDKLLMVGEDEYPDKFETDVEGKPIDGKPLKYPPWQKNKEGKNIGGQEIPEFNFCKRGVEVKKEGDEYVISPYKDYYYARFYAYNHWNVLGDWNIPFTNVNVGAMQPAGERIYTRREPLRIKAHQFALCVENGRLEFVRGDKVEAWAKAVEAGEDVGKYVALTVDLAMLASSAYEARAATLLYGAAKESASIAAKEGVDIATKEAAELARRGAMRAMWGKIAGSSWHFLLAATGFGRQLLENHLGAGKTFKQVREYAILADMSYQAFAPKGLQAGVNEFLYGTEGLKQLELVNSQMEWAVVAKGSKIGDRLLSGTEHLISGGKLGDIPGWAEWAKTTQWYVRPLVKSALGLRHGVMPYADYYYLWELNTHTGQTLVDAFRGQDPLHIQDAKDALFLGGPQARYDHRSPFEYVITPKAIEESAKAVMTEYGRSLSLAGFDHDRASFALSKEIQAAKDQDKDKKKQCVDHCFVAFVNPKSRAQKYVAAAGLLELCPKDGEPDKQVFGEVKGKKITRQDVIDFLDNSAEALNKKTTEILAAKLPEDNENRTKHKQKLVEVFLTADSVLEKRAAAEGLFKLCAKDGKLSGTLGEIEKTLPSGKKAKVSLLAEELTQYLGTTPDGLMREGRETLFFADDEPRKKKHIADAVLAFKVGSDDATKTAAAVALLGARKELKLDEVLGETTTYQVVVAYKDKEGEKAKDVQLRVVRFSDKESAEAYEKALKEKFKDDKNVLVSLRQDSLKVTANDALNHLRNQAINGDTPRMRLVAGDYMCRLSHIAEDGFALYADQFLEAQAKLEKSPDDEKLKADAASKRATVEAAKKFADLTRFDYTDMVGACFEVLATEHAPRDLKAEAITGKAGPRLDFLLEYFRYKVEPDLDNLEPNLRAERLAGLYKRDSASIEAVLQKIAKDKDADPDLRALAVTVLSANTANRVAVNGQPISRGTSVDIGSKTGPKVYVEAKGEGVAERHATITAKSDGTFWVSAIDKNEVWIKRPGEKEPTFIKITGEKAKIQPGDQVILGDKEKGSVLKFSSERDLLLARIRNEWSENSGKPGAYLELVRKRLKGDLVFDTESVTPLGGQDDFAINKFRAAVALDQLQDQAGFKTDADRTIAVNQALLDSFDPARPQFAMAVLAKLVEPVDDQGKPRIDTLTKDQLSKLRNLCSLAMTVRGINGQVTDELRGKVSLCTGIVENLPQIYKGADLTQLSEVVHKLQCFLLPEMKDDSAPFPAKFSSLREAAIDSLAKLSPETARLTLPDVVKNDKVENVRLKALEVLCSIGHPKFRELCIERLTDEDDPRILRILRRMEYFERRPDRASDGYKKDFAKACADILESSKRNLDGFECLISKSKEIDHLTPWKRGKQLFDSCIASFKRKFGEDPTYGDVAKWLKDPEFQKPQFKDFPYYEPFVKANVYTVISDGKGGKTMELGPSSDPNRAKIQILMDQTGNGDDFVSRANRSRNAILALRDISTYLVVSENPKAKDMVWAVETCLLKGDVRANIRIHAVEALTVLRKGGVISDEDFAVTIAATLQNELKKIPDKKNKFDFEDHEKLLNRLIDDLYAVKTPKAMPLLEAIVAEKDFPMPKLQERAEQLLFQMQERIGYFTEIYRADKKAKLADLAKPLQTVLCNSKTDVDTVCKHLCLALNGRPIEDKDDPRRNLAYMAAGDASPRIRELAGEFLMESKVKEDRERGAEILANIFVRKPTKGTGLDAEEFIDHLKKNPKLYPEGATELLDKAIAAAKKEELSRTLLTLGQGAQPYQAFAALLSGNTAKSDRAEYDRSLDYQAEFESALTEIKRSWNSKIPRYIQEFDLKKKSYELLDGTTLEREYSAAVIARYGETAPKRFERMFADKETIKKEETAAGKVVIDKMWSEYDALRKAAFEEGGDLERDFLKFVIRRGAVSFWKEHREDASKKAADTIYELCRLKAPGAGDFEGMLASVLVDDPTQSPYVRGKLLDAYLELVEPNGKISKERAAVTLAAVLRTDYQNMPKSDQPGYKESEQRQLLILKKLQDWDTHMVSAVLEAIAKDHPIASVKKKAGEILKDFAEKDVKDVLNFGRSLGQATLLPDDPRLGPIVEAMSDEKRPIDQRFRAANLIMSNGSDEIKAKHKTAALLVASSAAEKSQSDQVKFDAAKLLLTVPADDLKFPKSCAARTLARLAVTSSPGFALESQALLKRMNEDERQVAVYELISLMDKSANKTHQVNAAMLILQICPEKSEFFSDYLKSKALMKLVDNGITGDDELRQRLRGTLTALSPKQCLLASDCALKWAEDHKAGGKGPIADALMLSAALWSRADKETKSPAMVFKIAEKAVQLLGKDDDTTVELQKLVSGLNRDSLLKPVTQADFTDIIVLWRNLGNENEETRLGAALTLVRKDNKGVEDTFRFRGIDVVADLAHSAKSEDVRKVASARLQDLIQELKGPLLADDKRKYWIYRDSPTLQLAGAKLMLFESGSQVTKEEREAAIVALTTVAIKGGEATRAEAEKLLGKLKGAEFERAVSWLETMAFIAGRKEKPEKDVVVDCWKLMERLYEKAGVDPGSEKFLTTVLERKRAEGKADEKELTELSARIADRRAESSKDPKQVYSADSLDRYFKEFEKAKDKYGESSLELARAQLALAKVAFFYSFSSDNETVRGNTGRMAELHAKEALEVFRKKLPANSPELCDALYRLGIAELRQGKRKEAQEHLKEAFSLFKKQGDKLPAIDGVWIGSHLAKEYIRAGKYEEAGAVNKELAEVAKAKFDVGTGDQVIRLFKELVASYPTEYEPEKVAARAREIEPMLKQAFEISTATFGADDVESMKLMGMVAKNLGAQKKDKDALPLFEKAIKYFRDRPNSNKEELAELVSAYGSSLWSLDRKDDAEKAFEQARDLRIAREVEVIHFKQQRFKNLLGDGEPVLLSNEELEKIYKAKDERFEKMRAAEKKYGADSVEVAKERLAISQMFLKSSLNTDHPTPFENHRRAAIEHARDALKALKDKLGSDHTDLVNAHYQLAMADLWSGYPKDAVENLKQALAIAQKNPEKIGSGDTVWIASRLVLANIVVGDQDGMDAALATLTELAGKKPSKSDKGDVSRALDQVILAISNPYNTDKKPRLEAAEKLTKLAIDIATAHYGKDSVPVANLTFRQAAALAAKGNHETAAPLYKKALDVLEKKDGFDKEQLVEMFERYRVTLEKLKRTEEAQAVQKKINALKKST